MNTYSLKTLKQSVLPLCHGYEEPAKSIKITLGNTVIFKYDGGIWLLTCRHLMEKAWEENMIKSVLLSNNANYFLMWKESQNLRYHPADRGPFTMDLALYFFANADSFEPSEPLWSWDPEWAEHSLHEGDAMRILGIRSAQMTPELVVSSHPVTVEQVEGRFLDNTLTVSPEDYDRKLADQRVVQVDEHSLMELAGGLVATRTSEGWIPEGIVTGHGTVELKDQKDSEPQQAGIYTYTELSRLDEMLNPAEQKS